MSNSTQWRELLGSIISNPIERDRIANEIGVHFVTLTRWVSGDSSPRPHNLRQLLHALPQHQRTQLLPLIEDILPNASDFETDTSAQEIPYKFVMEVFETRASTPDLLRFWSITRLVLQRALSHLDPERVGMAITVVRCMPPQPKDNNRIRSLRESVGLGTPPWGGDLEEKALLLGAESLAGHVTVSCRLGQIGDLRTNKTFLPAYQSEHEVSAVACPIMYACRVAGCLLLSSTQANYFQSDARLSLIRGYTHLVSLAFEPDEFYDPSLIDLRIMPPPEVQQNYLASFRQRVLRLMQDSSATDRRLASAEAEQRVWSELEEILLNLSHS